MQAQASSLASGDGLRVLNGCMHETAAVHPGRCAPGSEHFTLGAMDADGREERRESGEGEREEREEEEEVRSGERKQEDGEADGAGEEALPNKDPDEEEQAFMNRPSHSTELFLGSIARAASEADVRTLCETVGELHSFSLLYDSDTGISKGAAFARFSSKEAASRALSELHLRDLKSKPIRVSFSSFQSQHRMFVGNLPKTTDPREIKAFIRLTFAGIEEVEVPKPSNNALHAHQERLQHLSQQQQQQSEQPQAQEQQQQHHHHQEDTGEDKPSVVAAAGDEQQEHHAQHEEQNQQSQLPRNKGFAFVSFYNAELGLLALRLAAQRGGLSLKGRTLTTRLAESKEEEHQQRSRTIFVKGIPPETREDEVREAFGQYGSIERATIPAPRSDGIRRNIAFVDFSEREAANAAVEAKMKHTIHGTTLEVSHAHGKGGYGGGGAGTKRKRQDSAAAHAFRQPPPPSAGAQH